MLFDDLDKLEQKNLISFNAWKKEKEKNKAKIILLLDKKNIQIKKLIQTLFNISKEDGHFNASFYTEKVQESSNDAAVYTIIKTENKKILIKLLNGEFNTEVFNQELINNKNKTNPFSDYDILKGFSNCPIPLFIVDKINSDLANQEQIQLKNKYPQKYLQKYSTILVAKKKKAKIIKKEINWDEIEILEPEIITKKLQSAIFQSNFTESELPELKIFMKSRKEKSYEDFRKTIIFKNNQIKKNNLTEREIFFIKLIELLNNMIEQPGNLEQIYDLIQTYNINKNIFE